MGAYVELYIEQGSTFQNVINLTDDITNGNINISGYTVTSRMKRSYYSQNVSANIICTISNSSAGEVTMSLPAANTANLRAGRYLFDMKLTSPTGNRDRVIEGIMTVTPEI